MQKRTHIVQRARKAISEKLFRTSVRTCCCVSLVRPSKFIPKMNLKCIQIILKHIFRFFSIEKKLEIKEMNFFHVSFAICNNKINIWNLSRHNKYAKHQFESIDDDGSQAENLKFDKWKTLKESLWVCEVFTVNPSQCDGSFGSVIFRRRFPVGFQCLLTELTSCVSHNTHTHTGDTNDLFTARLEKKVKSTSWSQSAQVRP